MTIFFADIQCSRFWTFDHRENKHTLYRRKYGMKKFCTSLREHATNVIHFQKRKMLRLAKRLKIYQDATECYLFVCRHPTNQTLEVLNQNNLLNL